MTAEVTIGGGARLSPAPFARGGAGRGARAAVHAHRDAAPHPAFCLRYRRRGGQARPRSARRFLQTARARSAARGGQAPPRRARRGHAALGAALRIYHLYLGDGGAGQRAVPSGGGVAGGADDGPAAARPASGRARPASAGGEEEKDCARHRCSTAPAWRWRRMPRATRCSRPISRPTRPASCAFWWWTAASAPNAPARWSSAWSRPRPTARWRCSACRRRKRLTPSINRIEKRLAEVTDEMRHTEKLDRQSPPARRADRGGRRPGSRRRGERFPLRRQPRLQ